MDVVTITAARERPGLRLITRPGIPTPWAQAAKSIIEYKRLDCVLAQEGGDDAKGAQQDWVGDPGAPHLVYEDERVRSGWAEILELCERLAPQIPLIPSEVDERARMYGLANEICGEMGLGWSLRLLMIEQSLRTPQPPGAFPERVARYLGRKYGYDEERARHAAARVPAILDTLERTLGGQAYFLGTISALDIYWATFGNMFMLLDDTELPAMAMARDAWRGVGGGRFTDRVPPGLEAHHRKMYEHHLGLPVQL